MAESQSATTSSSGSTKRQRRIVEMPLWIRLKRILLGKINKLPDNMNTTLILYTVQLYFTLPYFFLSKIGPNLKALLYPFRIIHEMGFEFEELPEKYRQLI